MFKWLKRATVQSSLGEVALSLALKYKKGLSESHLSPADAMKSALEERAREKAYDKNQLFYLEPLVECLPDLESRLPVSIAVVAKIEARFQYVLSRRNGTDRGRD